MAFTSPSTGDTVLADHINQLVEALNGTAGSAEAIALTKLNDASNFALRVRNLETGNSKALLVEHADGEDLLTVDDSGVTVAVDVSDSQAFLVEDEDGTDYLKIDSSGVTLSSLTVSGTGTVDGVDISAHTHTGGASDAPNIDTAGLADDAVTRAKTSTPFVGSNQNDYDIEAKAVTVSTATADGIWTQSGTWDNAFSTLHHVVIGAISSETTDKDMGRNHVYLTTADTSGFTVAAAASGGHATTYTVHVVGFGEY